MVKLRYQSIVSIYGRAFTDQELYIVLEYIDGGDLTNFLNSKEEIGWAVRIRFRLFFSSSIPAINYFFVCRFALQATRSVHYLHSLNPPILHRDLKSPNFLVCKPAMDLKLTDFGMSKVKSIASNVSESSSNAAGLLLSPSPFPLSP
jgi:serine/threonine protein kinase